MPSNDDGFYVGYVPRASSRVRRFIKPVAIALCVLAVTFAVILAACQRAFPDARFEFGSFTRFEGRVMAAPYPALLTADGAWWLVAPGKFGFDASAWAGRTVRLEGERIFRGQDRMIQVHAGSVAPAPLSGVPFTAWQPVGVVSLAGEIVDSKCFLGVMNPGEGAVHAACARRCISGGVPPALRVRDRDDTVRIVMLAAHDGGPFHREASRLAGDAVEVTGMLYRKADLRQIHATGIARLEH
jgi:hypothetical protein